ncbi:hypothetical protein FA95DRAFT_1602600 [Auriscalpium vulgare]|uniref:Uncharacterized protein n=1 Tax=Auriscalpium vulgare TaxID=40419 RepID=A0ACB8S550_9AGAM|nr:hypothetical protein FA95DRAFT_1602600 [Auriscalpium vulgare]
MSSAALPSKTSATSPSPSSAASGTQPAAASPAHKLDPLIFVFHVDLVLISLFALYVLLTLPRALAHVFQPSEFFNGLFLRAGAQSSEAPKRTQSTRTLTRADTSQSNRTLARADTSQSNRTLARADTSKSHGHSKSQPAIRSQSTRTNRSGLTLVEPSDGDHTLNSHAHFVTRARSRRSPQVVFNAPTRVPSWTTLTHPRVVYALNYRLATGLSVAKLAVLFAYLGVVLYAGLYRSNPFTDPVRAGYVAMSQIPIVVSLAGKNNWLSLACGVGYEKLNYLHRFAGRLVILAVNVHALGYLYKWSLNGTINSEFARPKFLAALVALGAADLLMVGTADYVRRRMYNLFVATHIVGLITFIVATYFHAPTSLPYILCGLGLYLCDHLFRLAKTRYTTAYITPEVHLNNGSTRIEIPSLTSGWRAGQHVRLRVVNPSRGSWLGWWTAWCVGRARPFTIASASGGKGLEMIAKKQGKWTGHLYQMATGGDSERPREKQGQEKGKKAYLDMDPESALALTRKVRVLVEGPYSGPGHTLFTAYSGALLIAGGSGITYILSVLEDILQKHSEGRSRLRVIEVVWSIGDPESFSALLPTLIPLLRPRASPHAPLCLRFTVHYTRASARPLRLPAPSSLPVGLHITPGRPNVQSALQGTIDSVLVAHTGGHLGELPSGVIVGTCGPVELGDEVTASVGRVPWRPWRDVGGVETVDEVFGW